EAELDVAPGHCANFLEQLEQTDRIGRSAAEIEYAPVDPVDVLQGAHIGIHRVADIEDVAHLLAVAVDGDRLALERSDEEMRDPALILGPHLPLSVDAAHPEHDRRNAEAAAVIEDILVSRAFGAAVGRMKIEPA